MHAQAHAHARTHAHKHTHARAHANKCTHAIAAFDHLLPLQMPERGAGRLLAAHKVGAARAAHQKLVLLSDEQTVAEALQVNDDVSAGVKAGAALVHVRTHARAHARTHPTSPPPGAPNTAGPRKQPHHGRSCQGLEWGHPRLC